MIFVFVETYFDGFLEIFLNSMYYKTTEFNTPLNFKQYISFDVFELQYIKHLNVGAYPNHL